MAFPTLPLKKYGFEQDISHVNPINYLLRVPEIIIYGFIYFERRVHRNARYNIELKSYLIYNYH